MVDVTFPAELPISEHADDIVAALRAHQVLVVAGETGSGKSTQLPKLCLAAGRGAEGRWIGHTQPRRIAARSIAERVAEELGTEVGETVGYQVRFHDRVGEQTSIKVMTDGILLAEIQRDRRLSRYDTIIIDEAHERSLNIDFLLGYLRRLLPTRPDLHLVITSATIDTARFSEHFDDAPVIEVEGRTYPVEIRYRPLDETWPGHGTTARPPSPGTPGDSNATLLTEPRDLTEGICDAVRELQREIGGDLLVFCSGEREIRDAAAALDELQLPDTEVFPLFARLSSAEQHRVFERHRGRRVVLATNVAETSLTVPGIRAVIDPGTARISRYSQRTKVQRLPIEPVSQASADQRAGRCGRVGPGICIRLYSESDYVGRPEFTEPEIRRTNLASVILQMANLGLGDISSFPFVEPPADRNIRDGIALLEELGAVDPEHQGSRRWLTPMGKRLVRMPVDPRLARMVVEAASNGCLHEVMVIASAMSVQDPRERPFDQRDHADQLHARFQHPTSDFLTYLNLWNHLADERAARSSSQFRKMCRQELLNFVRIREWRDVHDQLRRTAKSLGYRPNTVPGTPDAVHQSLLTGLLGHVGMKDRPDDRSSGGGSGDRRDRARSERDRRTSREFIGARNARFAIAPGSALTKHPPNWVMVGELVETTRLWGRIAAPVDPAWVERAGAHLARRSYGEPWWDPDRGAALTTERVTVHGLPVVAGRRVPVARVDPVQARDLFIHHALVEGEWTTHHTFMDRNAAVAEQADRLQARARRSDLVVERQAVFDFYDDRLPADVTTGAAFNQWWKQERRTNGRLLDLALDDLLADDAHAAVDHDAFPEIWHVAGHDLPVTYEFDPTDERDGATVTIDASIIGDLDPAAFDWNVPGFRADLVESLVRSLPKQLRKLFVPVPETVAAIQHELDPSSGPVVEVVRRQLNRLITAPLPADAFDLDRLPAHLRPSFRVVGADGAELAVGKDLRALAAAVHAESAAIAATVDTGLEQQGLRTWSIGVLPRVVEREVAGRRVRAYPALRDEGDTVAVVACTNPEEQSATMWDGTRRLVRLHMSAPARQVDGLLDQRTKQLMSTGAVQPKVDWYHDVISCALDHCISAAGGPAWDAPGWDRLVTSCRDELGDTLAVVGRHAASLVARHAAIRRTLGRLGGEHLVTSLRDAGEHLDRLVYEGVLAGVGFDRLDDLDRYLRALERRLDALPDQPRRDAERTAAVRRIEAEYDHLAETVSHTADLEALAWQLEELRVSVFAQQVGTAGPVSEQRIRKEIQRLARGL